MSKVLVANWKLNPPTVAEAVKLAKAIDKKGVVICPPFLFLEAVKKNIKRARLGSQNVFWKEKGAYTGEVSPSMLKDSKVEYVIVGHSERRRWLHETDEVINKKVLVALRAGLKVILCVGEPASVRQKGLATAKNFVKNQLQKDLVGLSKIGNLLIAYEPVWAIGTGRADAPEDAVLMAKFIKNLLKAKSSKLKASILYGGSATSRNIKNFLKYKEIDGALVGGASLKVGEFNKIIRSTGSGR